MTNGTYLVTIQSENHIRFQVEPQETILDAAIRQGIGIAYSCRNGTCRTCIFQVLEGEVLQEEAELCMISEQELLLGRRLLCMSTLKTDAVLSNIERRGRRAAVNDN